MMVEPRIRAVPNPSPETQSDFRSLVKTVAITSAVSSIVGVFAVAGGHALYNTIKKTLRGRREEKAQPSVPPQYSNYPLYPPEPPDLESMPEALLMRPHLRRPGARPRRVSGQEQIQQMFRDFERRAEERERRQIEVLDRLERRLTEIEDYDEEDAA